MRMAMKGSTVPLLRQERDYSSQAEAVLNTPDTRTAIVERGR